MELFSKVKKETVVLLSGNLVCISHYSHSQDRIGISVCGGIAKCFSTALFTAFAVSASSFLGKVTSQQQPQSERIKRIMVFVTVAK